MGRLIYDAEEVLDLPGAGHPHISGWLETSVQGNFDRGAILDGPLSDSNLPIYLVETALTVHMLMVEVAANDEERAAYLNNISVDPGRLGRREAALEYIQEAIEIRRDLAENQPEAFRSHLAVSLNNLSARLSDLGRKSEAFDAIREAVAIYRELAESRPETFRFNLAQSLNNLSSQLTNQGMQDIALDTAQESVDIFRDLTKVKPELYRPALADSLNNLSDQFGSLGKPEVALGTIQEALDIYIGPCRSSTRSVSSRLSRQSWCAWDGA